MIGGFQKREYQNVQLHVGERVQLDATLSPATVSESVLVVGESPQLEAGSATIGQVIDSKLISEIPLGDGTAYGLTRLIPGASFERSYALQRPMDNDNLRGMTITGDQQRVHHRRIEQHRVAGGARASSRPRTRSRSSRSRPQPTTRRWVTPARVR